jgi:hypothetical protein
MAPNPLGRRRASRPGASQEALDRSFNAKIPVLSRFLNRRRHQKTAGVFGNGMID